MMKIKPFLLLTFCGLVVFAACNSEAKKPEHDKFEKAREIYAESIEVHDKVMAEMSKSNELIRSLKEIKDSMSIGNDSLRLIELDTAISQLQKANKTMFSWMENIQSVPAPEGDKSEIAQQNVVTDTANIIQIQTIQKNKIVELEKQMRESIEAAEKLLK